MSFRTMEETMTATRIVADLNNSKLLADSSDNASREAYALQKTALPQQVLRCRTALLPQQVLRCR